VGRFTEPCLLRAARFSRGPDAVFTLSLCLVWLVQPNFVHPSPPFEVACVLVRLQHVIDCIVNANHGIATEDVSLCARNEILTAFVVERAIHEFAVDLIS
jgi:hypothetical protein